MRRRRPARTAPAKTGWQAHVSARRQLTANVIRIRRGPLFPLPGTPGKGSKRETNDPAGFRRGRLFVFGFRRSAASPRRRRRFGGRLGGELEDHAGLEVSRVGADRFLVG